MMNLFENLCNMQESAESDDSKILTIKVSSLAPMSEFDDEDDAKDWANWIEDDYNLEVLEQGDNSPENGYVIVKGDEYDLNNFIREVIDSESDINSTFVKILENLKEAELRAMTGPDSFAWQGVNKFPDGSAPMISEGKYGIMVIGVPDGEDIIMTSIYYGNKNQKWCWKSYIDKESAIKDGKILSKLLDDEIDEDQLKRFGFELI